MIRDDIATEKEQYVDYIEDSWVYIHSTSNHYKNVHIHTGEEIDVE